MSRIVKCGLLQAANAADPGDDIFTIKRKNIDRHLQFVQQASLQGVQILCFQELFYGPYFPAGQEVKWYKMAEPVPSGPTVWLFTEVAKEKGMALIVPVMEEALPGLYYNTAAVIDADGKFLGKYRKHHLPHLHPGFWEKFYFKPGVGGYPVFKTAFAKIGVYICYDRHFPEGARILGLNGAEIVFNPSATVAGLALHLWELELPAHAVANGYFAAGLNRVGVEKPWQTGEFFGLSFFCNPQGTILARASRDKEELLTADLDLEMIEAVRAQWQFYRDRRPESYGPVAEEML